MKSPLLVLPFLLLCAPLLAQTPDLKQVQASFQQVRDQASADMKARKKVTRAEINAALAEKAKAAIVGVDVTKIRPEEASDWSQVFAYAGMPKESGELAAKAASYFTMKAWMAQQEELTYLVDQGRGDQVVNLLRFAIASEVRMLAQMGSSVHGSITAKFGKTNPEIVLASYDAILNRLEPKGLVTKVDKEWGDICYAAVSADRCDFLYKTGHEAQALAALRALRTRFAKSESQNAFGSKPRDVIDATFSAWGAVHEPSPKLAFTKTIGDFPGLDKLRGKVVLLDFFAHWCGPCKRAFPEMRELYAKFKPQGLELVGMTSFYGYYDSEKGLSQAQEFERMKDFVKEFNMTWPVAFDATKANATNFKVSEIPHLTIIDRKGIIRMVTLGYDPLDKSRVESFIQKLLSESP